MLKFIFSCVFHYESLKKKYIKKKFIQIIIPRVKVLLESSFENFDLSKLHLIHHKFSKIKNIRRAHVERNEQETLASTQPKIHHNYVSKPFQSSFQSIWRPLCSSQNYIDAKLELKSYPGRSNKMIFSIVL